MNSLTSKRTVLVLTIVAAGLCLLAAGRPWVTGSLNDGVLSASAVTATGNQAVPGYFGIALAAAAGMLAAATGGRIVRWPAAIVSVIASIALVSFAIRTLLSPGDALKTRSTEVTGHNGDVLARGSMTAWFWLALFCGIVLLLASLAGVAGLRQWAGLSSKYDAPAQKAEVAESDWDLMSRGIDPTQREVEATGADATTEKTGDSTIDNNSAK